MKNLMSNNIRFCKKKYNVNKSIKCRLKDIFHPTLDYTFLENAVKRANLITFNCYHFIRLYILHQYHNKKNIPKLNKDFIMMSFRVLSKESRGPKPHNMVLFNDLNYFFSNHYIKLIYPYENINIKEIDEYKFDSANLSYILACSAESMEISYTNNIRLNFFKYVCQFVNESFKEEHENLINKCKSDKTKFKKELKSELRKVKDDLIYCTLNSDPKYHEWIKKYKFEILPKEFKKSYECDLKHYPYKYIKHMLFMNSELEQKGLKTFQPISLRTDLKDKYITINTNALISLLPTLKNKNDYNNCINKIQKDIWDMTFRIKEKKFKIKNYTFNYQIQTDGFSVSINFIHKNEIKKKAQKSKGRLEASKKAKEELKGKTKKQKLLIKQKKEEIKTSLLISKYEKNKLLAKKKREEFKKLSKEEQEIKKLQIKLDKDEFNYIEDLIKCQEFLKFLKEEHKNGKLVYGDPGKRSPLTLLGDNNKYYTYNTKRRLHDTKRLKYNKLIDNSKYKSKLDGTEISIKEIEVILSGLNSKTTNSSNFKDYVRLKIGMKNRISSDYNIYLKKINWWGYINKRRHEDTIINELKEEYGEDAIFILGDWGDKGRLSYISTPNIGLKRKLLEHFNVYHIDEYKTSKIHYKTKEECKNLKVRTKEGRKKIHSILTYQMSNGRLGCINRDVNAVNNMKIIVESLLSNGKRPIEYSRNSGNPLKKSLKKSLGVNPGKPFRVAK